VKDEAELERLLLDLALDTVRILSGHAQQPLASEAARAILGAAGEYARLIGHLGLRRLDERLVDAAIWAGAPTQEDLTDEAALRERVAPSIEARLARIHPEALPVLWDVAPDPEHASHRLVAVTRRAGAVTRTTFDAEFCRSTDYGRLRAIAARITTAGEPPYRLAPAEGAPGDELTSAAQLLDEILAIGKKGLSIQRYKGLGEMNPEQLAETTMDPGSRTLLQVRIEDAVEADLVFSSLMGDNVEPRREFIEQNALHVQNLDI
jgi:DNA gyrase subunit B